MFMSSKFKRCTITLTESDTSLGICGTSKDAYCQCQWSDEELFISAKADKPSPPASPLPHLQLCWWSGPLLPRKCTVNVRSRCNTLGTWVHGNQLFVFPLYDKITLSSVWEPIVKIVGNKPFTTFKWLMAIVKSSSAKICKIIVLIILWKRFR